MWMSRSQDRSMLAVLRLKSTLNIYRLLNRWRQLGLSFESILTTGLLAKRNSTGPSPPSFHCYFLVFHLLSRRQLQVASVSCLLIITCHHPPLHLRQGLSGPWALPSSCVCAVSLFLCVPTSSSGQELLKTRDRGPHRVIAPCWPHAYVCSSHCSSHQSAPLHLSWVSLEAPSAAKLAVLTHFPGKWIKSP